MNADAPRLELRLLEVSDAESLFALTERNRARLRHWLPWLDDVVEVANTRAFIEATRAQEAAGLGPTWGVRVAGELVGVAGFHPIQRADAHGGLGYWIDAGHEGRGIVAAACRRLIDYGFLELDLHRVEIRAAVTNERSRAVPERLGFHFEGILRECHQLYGRFVDLAIYSLVRTDWERRRDPPPPV